MNMTYAGFAGRADEWAINGNEQGADNLVRYQKKLRARTCRLRIAPFRIRSTYDAAPL
jgi:hypothetical protein